MDLRKGEKLRMSEIVYSNDRQELLSNTLLDEYRWGKHGEGIGF